MKGADPVQRRRDFRIHAPRGTMLKCRQPVAAFTMQVLDISLGGMLGAHGHIGKTSREAPFETGQPLEQLLLYFPGDRPEAAIRIKSARIIREEDGTDPACYRYGIEFTEVTTRQRKRLLDRIYYYQRQFLRQRLDINL
jgi:c-di-GMP-binding flagellar brake protein YcgR